MLHSVSAAGEMAEGAVQGLVGEHELGLFDTQLPDMLGVIVKGPSIGSVVGHQSGAAGFMGRCSTRVPRKGWSRIRRVRAAASLVSMAWISTAMSIDCPLSRRS